MFTFFFFKINFNVYILNMKIDEKNSCEYMYNIITVNSQYTNKHSKDELVFVIVSLRPFLILGFIN